MVAAVWISPRRTAAVTIFFSCSRLLSELIAAAYLTMFARLYVSLTRACAIEPSPSSSMPSTSGSRESPPPPASACTPFGSVVILDSSVSERLKKNSLRSSSGSLAVGTLMSSPTGAG